MKGNLSTVDWGLQKRGWVGELTTQCQLQEQLSITDPTLEAPQQRLISHRPQKGRCGFHLLPEITTPAAQRVRTSNTLNPCFSPVDFPSKQRSQPLLLHEILNSEQLYPRTPLRHRRWTSRETTACPRTPMRYRRQTDTP